MGVSLTVTADKVGVGVPEGVAVLVHDFEAEDEFEGVRVAFALVRFERDCVGLSDRESVRVCDAVTEADDDDETLADADALALDDWLAVTDEVTEIVGVTVGEVDGVVECDMKPPEVWPPGSVSA